MFTFQNWKVKLAYAGFGCLFGSLCTIMGMLASDVTAQRDKFGEIECTKLTVVDANGKVRASDVEQWLVQARQMALTTPVHLRGIVVLEQLLAVLTPKTTALLPNYPNPFNPETWIPYHLADTADVQVTIYDTKGEMVHQLDLGHQWAGYYTDRTRAAYWDGCNKHGETVAGGVYFYRLLAGDYSAMRKMVILK